MSAIAAASENQVIVSLLGKFDPTDGGEVQRRIDTMIAAIRREDYKTHYMLHIQFYDGSLNLP